MPANTNLWCKTYGNTMRLFNPVFINNTMRRQMLFFGILVIIATSLLFLFTIFFNFIMLSSFFVTH